MKFPRLIIAFVLAVSLAMLGTTGSATAAPKCDRQCLVVADVQKGLAVGFSMFRHDGTRRLPPDAAPGTDNKTQWGQFNLAALHIFKIRNGKLYEIEAPGAALPYGTKSGWETEEKVYPIPK